MALGFPVFGATYRYYLRKFREAVTRTPSAIILRLEFSNPKQPIMLNFPNANQSTVLP